MTIELPKSRLQTKIKETKSISRVYNTSKANKAFEIFQSISFFAETALTKKKKKKTPQTRIFTSCRISATAAILHLIYDELE